MVPSSGATRSTGNGSHVSCDGGNDTVKPSTNGNNAAHVGEHSAALKRKGDGGEEVSREKFAAPKTPSNFSKVDPALPREELAERFPLFLEAVSCTVDVKKGEMLFLPAGWFHEVSRGVGISQILFPQTARIKGQRYYVLTGSRAFVYSIPMAANPLPRWLLHYPIWFIRLLGIFHSLGGWSHGVQLLVPSA